MNRKSLLVLILFTAFAHVDGRVVAQSAVTGKPLSAATNMVTEVKGKLKGFQRGVLLVTRDDGTDVMLQLPEDLSAFNFVAKAKPAFLQRGMLVRFIGTFGPNGVPLAPVKRVEIFQPIAGQRMVGRIRERYVPGVYGERGQPQQPQQPSTEYQVVGNVMGITPAGIMIVRAGKVSLQVPLAEDVAFEIRFNNLTLAQEGDPVTAAGFYEPPDDTRVRAERITITTDRVYGEPAEKTPTRRTRGRTSAAAEKAAAAENKQQPTAEASETTAGERTRDKSEDAGSAEGEGPGEGERSESN